MPLALITYLDRQCITLAGPRIQQDLHISPQRFGLILSAFYLAYALFEIPSGYMGDRLGPRRVLTRIVLWWSVFTALTGAMSGFWPMLLTRLSFGAGEAGAFPNASVTISRWFPLGERARAIAAFQAFASIGAIASPLLVVPLQVRYGWRTSFLVFGLIGVVWAIAWYAWFRDTPAEKAGVTQAERDEIAEYQETSARTDHGLPWSLAFRSMNLWAVMMSWLCALYAFAFIVVLMPQYLQKARGFTEGELVWTSVPWMGGALGNIGGGFAGDALVRRLGLRRGRRCTAIFGLCVLALSLSALPLAEGKPATLFLLSLGFTGAGFATTPVLAVCQDIGREYTGAVTGATNTAGQLGVSLSSALFGYIAAASGSYTIPLIPMVLMLAIAIALWMRIDPTEALFPVSNTAPVAARQFGR